MPYFFSFIFQFVGEGRRPTRACLAGNKRFTIGSARFVTVVQISAMHKNLYAAVRQELLKFVVLLHWRGSAQNLPLGEGGPPRQRWWMRAVSFILSIVPDSTAFSLIRQPFWLPPSELLCDCHRQSTYFDSLRGAPPQGKVFGAYASER